MKLGIIGAGGYWGPNWVRVLTQLDVLSAVSDLSEEKMEALAEKHSLREKDVLLTTSAEELLDSDVDGVFIITPPVNHAELAVAAMNRGKHVFIEKPLADTLENSYRIKIEAEKSGLIAMVGHTFVYHPAVQKFKELLPEVGKLRTIYTIRTNFGLYQDIGIVGDLLPHDLSIFTYFCEKYPDKVRAEVNEHQDVAYVVAEYGDLSCSAFLSWSSPDKVRKICAVGDRGILEWDLSWSHINLHHKWATPTEASRFEHHDEGTQVVEVTDRSEPLMNEALHFIDCIQHNKAPMTGIEDGINVVKGLVQCQ